eukprot:g61780.t1
MADDSDHDDESDVNRSSEQEEDSRSSSPPPAFGSLIWRGRQHLPTKHWKDTQEAWVKQMKLDQVKHGPQYDAIFINKKKYQKQILKDEGYADVRPVKVSEPQPRLSMTGTGTLKRRESSVLYRGKRDCCTNTPLRLYTDVESHRTSGHPTRGTDRSGTSLNRGTPWLT